VVLRVSVCGAAGAIEQTDVAQALQSTAAEDELQKEPQEELSA
jgi:hypothetical protein